MAGTAMLAFDGDTGTEFTCMTSSWKSIGSSMWFALSFLSTTGAGTDGFAAGDGLRAGLVCLARGGGGNNWKPVPVILSLWSPIALDV
jgi:hypothetical protein